MIQTLPSAFAEQTEYRGLVTIHVDAVDLEDERPTRTRQPSAEARRCSCCREDVVMTAAWQAGETVSMILATHQRAPPLNSRGRQGGAGQTRHTQAGKQKIETRNALKAERFISRLELEGHADGFAQLLRAGLHAPRNPAVVSVKAALLREGLEFRCSVEIVLNDGIAKVER